MLISRALGVNSSTTVCGAGSVLFDMAEGDGVAHFTGGSKYTGKFHLGMMHGEGIHLLEK